VVAGAADEIVQAGAFASQDKDRAGGEIVLFVVLDAALIQADNPQAALLQQFQGAHQIHHARQAEMFGGAGGGFDGHRAQRGGAALSEEDAIDPGAFSAAQQSAQILGVFHAVQSQDQARLGTFQQVFGVQELALPDHGDDALVGGRPRQAGKGLAGLGAELDPRRPAEGGHLRQALIVPLAGHANVVKAPRAGAQSFLHRVEAVKNHHYDESILGRRGPCNNGGTIPGQRVDDRFSARRGEDGGGGNGLDVTEKLEKLAAGSVFRAALPVCEDDMSTAALQLAEEIRQENVLVAEGLKRHDPELIDRLILQYQHRLLRYLLYLTGNRERAEDLFQETWMRVLLRGSQFKGHSRFDTWLFTIARNLVIDLRRRRPMASLEELFEKNEDDRPFEIPSREKTPFDHLATLENGALVAEALLTLEPLQREVLTLRFHEEMSLEEIARLTRAPLSTVKSRLYRGLAALKPRVAGARIPSDGHQEAR
jgi:RNA polymerase sigma-70 factor (ECF subfamily)